MSVRGSSDKRGIGYIGVGNKYIIYNFSKVYTLIYKTNQLRAMNIYVDTREQKPLWSGVGSQLLKLDEGDYTTEDLYGFAHAERKSAIDLYGSLIQGHVRFRKELLRAVEKNLTIAIFVECPKSMFVGKKFPRGYLLKTPPKVLAKIVSTIEHRYNVNFVWCKDRDDMR